MYLIFLGILSVYWIVAGVACYRYLRKQIEGPFQKILKTQTNILPEYKPFERTDFSQWDLNKIYLNCFLVFPFKFAILFSLVVIAVLLILCITWIEKITRLEYITPLRKLFKFYMNVVIGTVLYLLCWTTETNLTKKTNNDPIVISNHISWWEIVYFVTTRWPIAFLAKYEVQHWPLIGTIAKFGGSIFIERQNNIARQITIKLIKQRCEDIKRNRDRYPPLLIFPEGTTTNGNYLINFKRGAFECLQPIQISTLKYVSPNWNVSLDNMGQLPNILLFLCHFPRLQIFNMYNVVPKSQNVEHYIHDCQRLMSSNGIQRQIIHTGYRHKSEYEKLQKLGLREKQN